MGFTVFFSGFSAAGANETEAAQAEASGAAQQSLVMLGSCELERDPGERGLNAPRIAACVRARMGAEVTTIAGAPKENFWVRYAQGGVSLHGGSWLALATRARLIDVLPLSGGDRPRHESGEPHLTRETEYAVVQIGNPVLHRTWLAVGQQRLPFGLDLSAAPYSYQGRSKPALWDTPRQTAVLSLDDQQRLRLDVAYGSNEIIRAKDESERLAVHAGSFRAMLDMAALDGSRFVVSGYGENRGARRYGLGFVTVSRKGDETSFEFVRGRSTPDGRAEPFRQLLRFSYVGTWRDDSRWIVQVDDERFAVRKGMIGYDVQLMQHAVLRLGISHVRSEGDEGGVDGGARFRRWQLTSGLEARL